jgi:2-polyprenyl-6-methoxyphenol hydroxylase-like FAD-dependent oxidoreductase
MMVRDSSTSSGVAPRIAVIGAGIGGLTAALALAHQGVSCTVFEQAPELREIGAGVALWPPALAVFDHLGIGDAVRALGRPWRIGGLRRADGSFLVRYSAAEFAATLGEPTIAVHRGELQSLVLSALDRSRVRTGYQLEAADEPAEGRVTLRFANGSTSVADVVIAADGLRSTVRQGWYPSTKVQDRHYYSWRGTAQQPPATDWHEIAGETWGPGGRFGLIPIGASRVSWYAAVNDVGTAEPHELHARFGSWHDPIPDVIDATPPAAIWRDRIYDRRPLLRWNTGRIALLGDAAHPMTPELGQGACQAILDAYSLAHRISTEPTSSSAFRAYNRDRKARAWLVTLAARAIGMAGRADGPVSRILRETAISMLPQGLVLRQLRLVSGPRPAR